MLSAALSLPFLLLGPQIRRAEPHAICISVATTTPADLTIELIGLDNYHIDQTCIELGKSLFLRFFSLRSESGFPTNQLISYQLQSAEDTDHSEFCYDGASTPRFIIPTDLTQVLHGSCRNPHHDSQDGLVAADHYQARSRDAGEFGAELLILSGDQVYCDDVAAPMLYNIHQVISLLGIYPDKGIDLTLPNTLEQQLYKRARYLPITPWRERDKTEFGYWLRKDWVHFTSLKAANHLIYFEEFIALYVLTFSSRIWSYLGDGLADLSLFTAKEQQLYQHEQQTIQAFSQALPACSRLYANISTLMMFDDHDVTDDWNLTAAWERAVYQNKNSRRIVANGIISYWLFQGIGNDNGEKTAALLPEFKRCLVKNTWQLTKFDNTIFKFDQWSYHLNCQPSVVVIDSRTQRWRNEQNFHEPSGLLDWQQLTQLEEAFVGKDEVILVSPAPVFGVKSIEAIQAVFNFCGQPLLVDVENWMAHEGAARKLMQIFRRGDTPCETLILSGDVHYSFCFSVQARFSQRHNRIWQLTASGIKNEFPTKLLRCLNKIDSVLYGRFSPLNFFTKRWQMKVAKHTLVHNQNQHLISKSGISLIVLADHKLVSYQILHGNGQLSEFDLNKA